MLNKIEKIWNKFIEVIMAIVGVTVAIAWIVTFFSITYGLAIWSTNWFTSLLQGVI